MPHTFVLSDESINRNGFRTLTDGINLDNFKKNPIMLFMHKRTSRWNDDNTLPIGIWENIRVENGKLLADPKFDEGDEFAVKIKNKVEGGFLKMASIGFEPIELSDDPKFLVKGQTRSTVTKCDLLEASIVDIGSNKNALKLYKDGSLVELSADTLNTIIPELLTQNSNKQMKQLAVLLSLALDATEDQMTAAVKDLITKNQTHASELSAKDLEISNLKTKLDDINKLKVKTLLDNAILAKKFTEAERATYQKLCDSDFDLAVKVIGDMKGVDKVVDTINKQSGDTKNLSWDDLHKEGKLESLKAGNLPQFKQLYFDKFGKEHKD